MTFQHRIAARFDLVSQLRKNSFIPRSEWYQGLDVTLAIDPDSARYSMSLRILITIP